MDKPKRPVPLSIGALLRCLYKYNKCLISLQRKHKVPTSARAGCFANVCGCCRTWELQFKRRLRAPVFPQFGREIDVHFHVGSFPSLFFLVEGCFYSGEGFIPPCRRFPAGRCFRLRSWACRRVRGRRFPVWCRAGDAGAACRRVRVPGRGRGTARGVDERPG